MTATRDEMEEGVEEGVILHSAHSFLRIVGNGKVEGVELQQVNKFYFDENRKAVIELVEGTKEILSADTVIFAVGQKPRGTEEMELELTHGPYIAVNENMETSAPGVYAAGDVVTGTQAVIKAIAAGRTCAIQMDLYLGGDGDISEQLTEPQMTDPYIGQCKGFGDLKREGPKMLDLDKRIKSFEPVEHPYDCDRAKSEASRCLQCDLRINISKPKLWNEY